MTLFIKPPGRGNFKRSSLFCSLSEYEARDMVGKSIEFGGAVYRVVGWSA